VSTPELNDHELAVLAMAAARGKWDSRAQWAGGALFDDLPHDRQTWLIEDALPYIIHGWHALPGLGFHK
jgi:hypothetical protein